MIPWFDGKEPQAMADYMASGGFLTEYTKTVEFEESLRKYTGADHVVVVSNGTISLWMMLIVLGISSGDEVIVPNYTMIATANAIRAVGAKPVFCDVEESTLCLDIEALKMKVSSKTRAIFLVNANGRYPSYPIEELINYCDQKGFYLLEDSAQGLGSFYPCGQHVGTMGIMGSFSFSVPKIITTGQGGAVVTNDSLLAGKLRKLKDFGRAQGGIDVHDTFGLNFKFTDIQAVVGLVQMGKLEERVKLKKKIWQTYSDLLQDLQQVKLFEHNLENTSPWFIDALVQDRDNLMSYLKDNGVGSRVMYPPINQQKTYQYDGVFPISECVGKNGIWLPSQAQLSEDEIIKICTLLKEFYLNGN
jgi:perosamine synthetase